MTTCKRVGAPSQGLTSYVSEQGNFQQIMWTDKNRIHVSRSTQFFLSVFALSRQIKSTTTCLSYAHARQTIDTLVISVTGVL
jgi:hypothetical protein